MEHAFLSARVARLSEPAVARRALLLVGALLIAAVAYRAAGDPSQQPWRALALWLASVALVLAAARAFDGTRAFAWDLARVPWAEVALVTALGVGALLLRTVDLATIPNNFGGDEAESADFARSVLGGAVRDPFSTGWAGHPTLWFFLQALSLRVFGDDVVGARMLPALLGAAAVPAVYVFARSAFGRTTAVVAAVLLATWHFDLHYSRIGVNSIGDPLLMVVTLALLVRGLRTGSWLTMASAGTVAGLAQHFYLGSRLLPFVVSGVVLHQLAFDRDRVAPRAIRALPLTLLAFLVAYGPGIRVPIHHSDDYNARLHQVGVFQSGWFDARRSLGDSVAEIAWSQFTSSVGAFTNVADRSSNYWPQMPLLDSVSAIFFVLGAALALRGWRRSHNAALLVWLAGTIVAGGMLVVDSPQSHRYVTAAPAVSVLVALGITRAGAAFAWLAERRRLAPLATAAVTVGIALWSLNFYFRDYSERHTYGFRQGEEITEIGRYLHDRAQGSFVYFFGAPVTFLDVGTIRFLAPEVEGTDIVEPLTDVRSLPPAPSTRRLPLFVFYPGRLTELAVVRSGYPNGVLRPVLSKADGEPLFFAYEPPSASPDRS